MRTHSHVGTGSVVMGQEQGWDMGQDKTVQDMFLSFYVQDIFGTVYNIIYVILVILKFQVYIY